MLTELSRETSAIVGQWRERLVHIGGRGISGRTGIVVGEGLVASLALEAQDGESVPVFGPDGLPRVAKVQAFDRRSGLVLITVEGLAGGALSTLVATEAPAVGSLALTVAHPSPQGVEASLAMVRFVGGASVLGGQAVRGHFQTDGQAWPGFGGAAVLDTTGRLTGVVVANQAGNAGWILPAAEWLGMVDALRENGSWQKPWIGVSLMPVRLDADQVRLAGAGSPELALVVKAVAPDSPAQAGGIRPGDLLLGVDGKALDCGPDGESPCESGPCLPEMTVGRSAAIAILRGDQRLELTLTPRAAKD
jgi:S1-C subfamily serine protease